MDKLKIPYPVIVEGKYDRLRLLSVMDGTVLTTDGFGLFKKTKKPLSSGRWPPGQNHRPDRSGRRRHTDSRTSVRDPAQGPGHSALCSRSAGQRKTQKRSLCRRPAGCGRAGTRNALAPACAFFPLRTGQSESKSKKQRLHTHYQSRFFEDGLTGQKNAALRRDALAAAFSLPPGMTPNALLSALNILTTREGYREKLKNL